jgi:PHD/YefM family antitoxin component YafN of YafNO toxin-antitoxin module
MRVYTFSEARQNFASLLEKAEKEGVVLIKRKDGSLFRVDIHGSL